MHHRSRNKLKIYLMYHSAQTLTPCRVIRFYFRLQTKTSACMLSEKEQGTHTIEDFQEWSNMNSHPLLILQFSLIMSAAGRNSCLIVSGDVSNSSYRLKEFASQFGQAFFCIYAKNTQQTIAKTESRANVSSMNQRRKEAVTPVGHGRSIASDLSERSQSERRLQRS